MGVRISPPVQLKNERIVKLKAYIQESFDELLHKVSWPAWSELQSSSIIVLVASLLIAVVVFTMDSSFSYIMKFIYNTLF